MSKKTTTSPALPVIALKNIRAYAWLNLRLSLVFAMLAMLICLFSGYNLALLGQREEILKDASSGNVFVYQGSAEPAGKNYEIFRSYIQKSKDTYVRVLFGEALLSRIAKQQGEGVLSPSVSHFALRLGDRTYTAAGTPFYVLDRNSILEADRIEMQARDLGEPVLGRLPEQAGEVVLAEPYLALLGLRAEDVMGKEVELYIKGEEVPLTAGVVCGCLTQGYFQLTGHLGAKAFDLPSVLLHESDPAFDAIPYRIYLYEPEEWVTHVQNREILTYGYRLRGGELLGDIYMLEGVRMLANNLYTVIGGGLAAGLFVMILLMVEKYVRIFARQSGILLAFGMRRSKLFALLFLQLLFLCVLALPVSAVVTVAGYVVIGLAVKLLAQVTLAISAVQLVRLLAIGAAAVFAAALLCFLLALPRLMRRSVKEFFTTEAVN